MRIFCVIFCIYIFYSATPYCIIAVTLQQKTKQKYKPQKSTYLLPHKGDKKELQIPTIDLTPQIPTSPIAGRKRGDKKNRKRDEIY